VVFFASIIALLVLFPPNSSSSTANAPLLIPLVLAVAVAISSYIVVEQLWKPDLYVLSRILEALCADGPTGRTKLCMKSGLNYNVFRRYLAWMQVRGLATLGPEGSEPQEVTLTQAGNEARESLNKLLSGMSLKK